MNRLRELRVENNLYQKDISNILNMSQTGYSKYEMETNDIPTDILKKLAHYYKVSIDYLLCETDIKEPYSKSKIIKDKNE